MPNGIITSASSNLYQIEVENKIYNCTARGKFKKAGTSLLVGDKVEITIASEEKSEGVIEQVLPRYNEIKRPKMANLTELILVVSMKMPSPDLLLLDKELVYRIQCNRDKCKKQGQYRKNKTIFKKQYYCICRKFRCREININK